MLLLAVLTGCGGAKADAAAVRAHYEALDGFTAQLAITAAQDDLVQEYQMEYTYSRSEPDRFTITAPESIAGIGGTIAGTDNAQFSLQYDGMQLDDAMPQRTGLTPADSLFCLLNDLRTGEPAQMWTESADGSALLVLRYTGEDADGTMEKQVWLTEDTLQPVYAELYADGSRVLTLRLTGWQTENNGDEA